MLRLYTQPNCPFCDLMKEMLDQTSHKYEVVNIREDPGALVWIRDRGKKLFHHYNQMIINIIKKVIQESIHLVN